MCAQVTVDHTEAKRKKENNSQHGSGDEHTNHSFILEYMHY